MLCYKWRASTAVLQMEGFNCCVINGGLQLLCYKCRASTGVLQIEGFNCCVTNVGLQLLCYKCRASTGVLQIEGFNCFSSKFYIIKQYINRFFTPVVNGARDHYL